MDDEFQALVERDLAAVAEPPIGDLVAASVRQGRRLRTLRRFRVGGTAAAVAVVLTAGAIGGQLAFGNRADNVVALAGSAQTTPQQAAAATGSWTPPKGAPATGPRVKATPAGELALLVSLLPDGQTSGYARAVDGSLLVQTYLDDGSGPGMLRVSVGKTFSTTGGTPSSTQKQCGAYNDLCSTPDAHDVSNLPDRTLADGSRASVYQLSDNCVQRTVVDVRHPDSTEVQINIASCLAWNGKANPTGRQALTVDQAIAIADDSRWGTMLAKSLVDAGARQFPHLATIG